MLYLSEEETTVYKWEVQSESVDFSHRAVVFTTPVNLQVDADY